MRIALALLLLGLSLPALADGAAPSKPAPGNDSKDGIISTPIRGGARNLQRLDPQPIIYDSNRQLIGSPPAKDGERREHALGLG